MVSLVEEYSKSPQALQESSAVLSSAAPPPLTNSLQKVPKDEAVSLHLARHSMVSNGTIPMVNVFNVLLADILLYYTTPKLFL